MMYLKTKEQLFRKGLKLYASSKEKFVHRTRFVDYTYFYQKNGNEVMEIETSDPLVEAIIQKIIENR